MNYQEANKDIEQHVKNPNMQSVKKELFKKEITNVLNDRITSLVLQNANDRFANDETIQIQLTEINQLIKIIERM